MIYLVCEGKPGGIDERVLDLLIIQKLGRFGTVKIEPAGGGKALESVKEWFVMRSTENYYVIRDRDYHSIAEAQQTWQLPATQSFMWQRHEIENYLLEPRVVVNAFQAIQITGCKDSDKLPLTEQDVIRLLEKFLRDLLEDQAGKLTLFAIDQTQKQCQTQYLFPKRETLLVNSLKRGGYPDQYGWLQYLQQECVDLKRRCQNFMTDGQFDYRSLEQRYQNFLARLHSLSFQELLVELPGKEVMAQVLSYFKKTLHLAQYSLDDLQTELLQALNRLYQPGFFGTDDDFQALAQKLT